MVTNTNGATPNTKLEEDDIDETCSDGHDHESKSGLDTTESILYPSLYPVVFFCMDQKQSPRYWCLRSIANPWFERLSIIVILINCISLGLYDPCQNKGGSDCHSTKEMFRKI